MQNAYETARGNKGKCGQPPLCIYPTGLGTSGISIKAVSEGHMIADNISTSIPFITAAVSLPVVLLGVLSSKIAFVKLKWILSWGRRSRYLATLMNRNY